MNRMNPAAIKEIGNALYEAAFNKVAEENELTKNKLLEVLKTDDLIAIRIESYMRSALNFAISKL